jgi:hypothetical protein
MLRSSDRSALGIVLLLAIPLLIWGQNWGLPSRVSDHFLFGGQDPWPGARILALAGGWQADPDRGADVAAHPLEQRQRAIVVNDTDEKRAKILLRYRLYSNQPDEMITFRSLAGMRPGTGPRGGMDPRLYQYGGLWIYPVGLLLKLGPVTLRRDISFYLDHPEAFGRFYVIARLYSAFWGWVGVGVVFLIVRRIGGGWGFPMAAAGLFALLPVVVDLSHEAKPHLAGAVLTLCAALAGSIFLETGRPRAAWIAGALCGAATGMVLSAYPSFLILAGVVLLRRSALAMALKATALGIVVYFLTNPYVAINLICNREVLRSNLGNSAAMYHAGASGSALGDALNLIACGAGTIVAVAGAISIVMLGFRAMKMRKSQEPAEVRRRSMGLLLAVPAIWILVQFVAFAAGKPGEYGRFGLYVDIVLAIEAVVAIQTLVRPASMRVLLIFTLLEASALLAAHYLAGFRNDAVTRTMTAIKLAAELNGEGKKVLIIPDEPAPYCLPPVNLFAWQIELAPRGVDISDLASGDNISVQPMEQFGWDATPLSWAAKRFEIHDAIHD